MSLTALTLALVLAQTPAKPDVPSTPGAPTALQKAEAAAELLEFDDALRDYQMALKQPGTREERVRAWKGMGLALAFMNRQTEARRAFATLLQLDPTATVPSNLGPKIAKPFEAARRLVQKRQPKLTLDRDRYSGELVAELVPADLPIQTLQIHARRKGSSKGDVTASAPAEQVLVGLPLDPTWDVEAFAVAEDAFGGVLLEAGTAKERRFFAATQEPDPSTAAVSSAKTLAEEERRASLEAEESGGSKWPWIVGAVGIVGAGVATAVVLSQGGTAAVSLPVAARSEQLP